MRCDMYICLCLCMCTCTCTLVLCVGHICLGILPNSFLEKTLNTWWCSCHKLFCRLVLMFVIAACASANEVGNDDDGWVICVLTGFLVGCLAVCLTDRLQCMQINKRKKMKNTKKKNKNKNLKHISAHQLLMFITRAVAYITDVMFTMNLTLVGVAFIVMCTCID